LRLQLRFSLPTEMRNCVRYSKLHGDGGAMLLKAHSLRQRDQLDANITFWWVASGGGGRHTPLAFQQAAGFRSGTCVIAIEFCASQAIQKMRGKRG
jgi:hypothetical protein